MGAQPWLKVPQR